MKFACMWGAAAAATLVTRAAFAQDSEPFTGPYLGVAVGAANHHFVAEEADGASNTRQFNVLKWGFGAEAFSGFDLAIAQRIRVGGEAQFEFGGRSAIERNSDYTFGFKPRYGFSASGRVGYLMTPRIMTYAGAGYGEHRYRTIAQGNVGVGARNSLDRTRSFILRAGAETRLSHRIGARIEFEHLDGSRNQFMLGVPIRF